MLWLAWKVANARPADDEPDCIRRRRSTFLQAAAFQWVNPKAWVIAISAIAIYVRPSHWLVDFAILLAVFALFTVLSTATLGPGSAWPCAACSEIPATPAFSTGSWPLLLVASIAPMVI